MDANQTGNVTITHLVNRAITSWSLPATSIQKTLGGVVKVEVMSHKQWIETFKKVSLELKEVERYLVIRLLNFFEVSTARSLELALARFLAKTPYLHKYRLGTNSSAFVTLSTDPGLGVVCVDSFPAAKLSYLVDPPHMGILANFVTCAKSRVSPCWRRFWRNKLLYGKQVLIYDQQRCMRCDWTVRISHELDGYVSEAKSILCYLEDQGLLLPLTICGLPGPRLRVFRSLSISFHPKRLSKWAPVSKDDKRVCITQCQKNGSNSNRC
jgi:hypothetical protein